jgi:IS605 OrfB family transposase
MFITLQTKLKTNSEQEKKLYSFFDRMNEVKRGISEVIFQEESVQFKKINDKFYHSFVKEYPDVQSGRIQLLMKLVCGHLKGFRTFLKKEEKDINYQNTIIDKLSDRQKKKLESRKERLQKLKQKTFLNYKKLSSVPNNKSCIMCKFDGEISVNFVLGEEREKIKHLPSVHRKELFEEQKARREEMVRLQKDNKNSKNSVEKENLLVHRNGKFFLYIPAKINCQAEYPANDFIGLDFGIENIVTTSDEEHFCGKEIEEKRIKCKEFRKSLQKNAKEKKDKKSRAKNVYKRLKKFGKKEARYKKDVNHCIAKKLVLLALETQRGIALENLKNIRKNKSFDKANNQKSKDKVNKMNSWGFAQLRDFITYKAKILGVPLEIVNPKNTSITCYKCKNSYKENRESQSEFVCKKCGNKDHADINSAKNISYQGLLSYNLKSRNANDNIVGNNDNNC